MTRTRIARQCAMALYCCLFMSGSSAPAGEESPFVDDAPASPQGAVAESGPAEAKAVPKVTAPKVQRDVAFEKYVSRKLLVRAIKSLDAQLLADVALQFAHAEQTLLRPHKSITADEVLGLAVHVASMNRDQAVLDRLGQAIESRGNEPLAAQVQAARQLASQTRSADPAAHVSIEDLSPRAFAQYQTLFKDIQNAARAADRDRLQALDERLAKLTTLGEREKQLLKDSIEEALSSLPEDGGQVIDRLARLSGTSRALQRVAIDPLILGKWENGVHENVISQGSDPMTATYTLKAFGQAAKRTVLSATDKARIYRMRTGPGTSIFLLFKLATDGSKLDVLRYDGRRYVAYATWTKPISMVDHWSGDRATLTKSRHATVRTPELWLKVWQTATGDSSAPAPYVDFSKHMVLAVFAGQKTSGGYSVAIGDLKRSTQGLTVYYKVQAPSGSTTTTTTTEMTSPYQLAVVPKVDRVQYIKR